MNLRTIALASVDAGGRLRALDPDWVDLLAEEIQREGQVEPIRVVERGAGFVLIDGARRLAALEKLGRDDAEAWIEPETALADAAFVRLGEIKGNMLRGELTVLDRALYLAAWRAIYESVQPPAKRGRKPAKELSAQSALNSDEGPAANDDTADAFVLSFSEAAQRALDISRRSLFLALKIATIDPACARRLAGHPSADSRTEMLALAEQSMVRQAAILDLMVGEAVKAATVAEAIVLLDGSPPALRLSPPERIHQVFARLRPQDQEAFFALNADAIERWLASRPQPARKAANLKSVA